MRILLFISLISATIITGAVISGCKKEATGGSTTPLPFSIPVGFPQPRYNFEGNPLTQEGFDLGRKLFYDGQLSADGNFPCASCHQQFAAFCTFDHDLSHGFNNQFTTRNAPGLFNLVWLKELHMDGGINHIEVQALAPLTAANEMAEDINNVIRKLKGDISYPPMFKAAFGSEEINSQKMLKALTQFMGSMVSANAKYDKVKRGEAAFSIGEQTGYAVFQAKCVTCHQEPLFTDLSYRNTGMTINPFLKDLGRMQITNNGQDSLKFRVPSLRNVMLTFPYTHDGRFYTIDRVLDHYSSGVQAGPTLDPLLKNGIPLTTAERTALKIFFNTLTDSSFIADKRFAQPQ
ncbi:MAG: cytochrome-c peroxidase [Chitinophagaceae bacterium]|nr:cytochrome-c peroxidase [Chitinophagaceae bacterium]